MNQGISMKKHVFLEQAIGGAPVDTQPVENSNGEYVELTSKRYFMYHHETFQGVKESLLENFNAEPVLWDTELNKVVQP